MRNPLIAFIIFSCFTIVAKSSFASERVLSPFEFEENRIIVEHLTNKIRAFIIQNKISTPPQKIAILASAVMAYECLVQWRSHVSERYALKQFRVSLSFDSEGIEWDIVRKAVFQESLELYCGISTHFENVEMGVFHIISDHVDQLIRRGYDVALPQLQLSFNEESQSKLQSIVMQQFPNDSRFGETVKTWIQMLGTYSSLETTHLIFSEFFTIHPFPKELIAVIFSFYLALHY